MSETFVIDIANGDAVQNKIATTLNQAGSSPTNPILRGLGMAMNFKFSPDVLDFDILIGRESPAVEKPLVPTLVNSNQYRLAGRAGYGDLGFDSDYTTAKRQFVRVNMATAGHVQGIEREMWIQEDPRITAFLTSAHFAWCDLAAAQYYETSPSGPCNATEGIEAAFNNDPGKPPTGTIQDGDYQDFAITSATPDVAQVVLGPDKVVMFGIYGTGSPSVPITVPITIMDDWRDEFNIKHYGGAKYVSVFEAGLAEDVQGGLITNRYQEDITDVTSIEILSVDPDTEYAVTFRFRSDLGDPYYVDKTIRFRVVTADMLTREVTRTPAVDDCPDIIYDAETGDLLWDDDGVFTDYGPFSVVEAWIIKGYEKVALPTNAVDPFSVDALDHRALIHGGLLTVHFRRETFFYTEVITVTYEVQRPNGSGALPINIVKKFGRQTSLVGGTTNFTPDTQVRLIRPTGADEDVSLEVLNVQTKHVAAIFWTDLGSISLDCPLKAGAKYDVTHLFTIDSGTGSIQQGVFNLLLVTDHSIQVFQQQPVTTRQFMVTRNPAVETSGPESDFVLPVLTPDYPDLDIEWPALTDQGNTYELAGYGADDPSDPSSERRRFFIKGRKGIKAIDNMTPGDSTSLAGGLSEICYPEESTFEVIYSIDHTFGDDVHYVLEKPTWLGYDDVPPPEVVSGDLQVIAYEGAAIFTVIPPNTLTVTLTGNLGSHVFPVKEIIEDQSIDLVGLGVWDGVSASISLEYDIYNPSTESVDSFGPYTVPKFESILSLPTTEADLPRTIWRPTRLVEWDGRLPKARVQIANKRLRFDYDDVPFSRYTRFKVVNPLDGTQILFPHPPFNQIDYDVRRIFRTDSKYRLQAENFVLVTFLHETGASKTALYKISGEFEEPQVIDDLRGQF